MSSRIPAVIIGASGYVGGELLRLIAGHPNFELAAAVSDSVAGKTIGDVFGHLATAFLKDTFVAHSDWLDQVDTDSDLALFSAAPHGASAAVIAAAIDACEQRNINVHVVDSSADFRFARQEDWEAVYKAQHGAPQLLDRFICALPEHADNIDVAHVGHPGCFATASTLATVPLIASRLTETDVFISGVTGSTGSGEVPIRRDAPPRTQQQLLCLQTTGAPACARSRRTRRSRERPKDERAFRAALRTIRTRHSCDASGEGYETCD